MRNSQTQQDPLREKTFQFAIRVVKLSQFLVKQKNEYTISKQILRAGTNPGAMVREAAHAESGLDFIHKLAIARKETKETIYWLELLLATEYISPNKFISLHGNAEEILKILTSSIRTKKKNLGLKLASVLLLIAGVTWMFF